MDSTIETTLTTDQRTMLNAMNERNRERTKGWKIHVVKDMPPLSEFKEAVIVGNFAFTCMKLKEKWYDKTLSLYTDGGWTTPGDIARDYLALKFPQRRIKVTSSQWLACVNDKGVPPLYCCPGQLDNGVYLDLTSAYWQIVRSVGWNVDYNPRAWLGGGDSMLDFPYAHEKLSRNCLVSCGLSGVMSIWTGSDMLYQKRPNRFINMLLWRLVQDVLNAIAIEMIQLGAIYVYSDGYILDDSRLGEANEILASWGLVGKIKHRGYVDVRAPASFAFFNPQDGVYATKPYQQHETIHELSKVYNPGVRWLRKQFSKLAGQANKDWLFAQREFVT